VSSPRRICLRHDGEKNRRKQQKKKREEHIEQKVAKEEKKKVRRKKNPEFRRDSSHKKAQKVQKTREELAVLPALTLILGLAIPKKIFLFSGSEFDFFYFSERGCSTGESKKMYQ